MAIKELAKILMALRELAPKKLLIAHSFFSVQILAVSFSQAAASGM